MKKILLCFLFSVSLYSNDLETTLLNFNADNIQTESETLSNTTLNDNNIMNFDESSSFDNFYSSYKNTFFKNWSDANVTKFNFFMALQVGDILSTNYAIKSGNAIESNTLIYTTHPDLWELTWKKTLFTAGIWYIMDNFLNESDRSMLLDISNFLYISIDLQNYMIGAKYKF